MTVFVSYSSRDAEQLKSSFIPALRLGRIPCWFDDELRVGTVWWQEILGQIRGCDVFVVALSENWVESSACRTELDYAVAVGRPVLAVRIGGSERVGAAMPNGVEVVDFRTPDSGAGAELITAVRRREAVESPLPVPLPPDPDVPYAYLQRAQSLVTSPRINARQQRDAFDELKAALDDPAGDGGHSLQQATALLAKLRDHPDVLHAIRREVVDLPGVGERARKGRRSAWALLAVAVVVVAAVVLVVLHPWRGSPETGPTVTAAKLRDVLLPTDGVGEVMQSANMEAADAVSQLGVPSAEVLKPECLPVVMPGVRDSYGGDGWDAVALQWMHATNPDKEYIQFALRFFGTREATTSLDEATARWTRCVDQVVTFVRPDGTRWADLIVSASRIGPRLEATYRELGDTPSWWCQHALAVAGNVAVEAQACGQRIGDEAARAVDRMLARAAQLEP